MEYAYKFYRVLRHNTIDVIYSQVLKVKVSKKQSPLVENRSTKNRWGQNSYNLYTWIQSWLMTFLILIKVEEVLFIYYTSEKNDSSNIKKSENSACPCILVRFQLQHFISNGKLLKSFPSNSSLTFSVKSLWYCFLSFFFFSAPSFFNKKISIYK